MNFDPEATLRCWAVDVEVGGDTYTIPARPAADWLLPVTLGSLLDIVPGMLEDPAALDDRLATGGLGDECQAAARAAITAAAGCPWWTATRLARAVADTWVGGEFTLRSVDATRIPFAAYLAAVYRVATKDLDEQKRAALDMQLDQPPAGLPPEEWYDEDQAEANFAAAAAKFG